MLGILGKIVCVASAGALLLAAADAVWKTKDIRDWSEEDARSILAASPWSASVRCMVKPLQPEAQRREEGQMGQPQGVGYKGLQTETDSQQLARVMAGHFTPPPGVGPITVRVRWESATPIRAAELKAHEVEPPTLEGDGYQIAVYGIPGTDFKKDPKTLGEPLKPFAVLRRDGKPDARPSRVEVFESARGIVVAYLFPYSAELSERDTILHFDALIGRVAVVHDFDLREMRIDGKLAL